MADVSVNAKATDAIKRGGGKGFANDSQIAGTQTRGTQGTPTPWREPGDLQRIIAAAKAAPNVRRNQY